MAKHETFKALVEADRMELLLRYPFLGRVICQCELVPVQSPNAPIACNDCRRIYLSERAYRALSPDVRLAVLAHEVLHITLSHAFRKGNRDEERFSFAADAEIYPLLRDDFPQQGMVDYDEDWNGLTAEEIYELLPKNLPETPPMHCYPSNTPSDDGHGDKEDANYSKDESLSCDGAENAEGAATFLRARYISLKCYLHSVLDSNRVVSVTKVVIETLVTVVMAAVMGMVKAMGKVMAMGKAKEQVKGVKKIVQRTIRTGAPAET